MEGEACSCAVTGMVVLGGDWAMVAIGLDSTGWVLDDVPTSCMSRVVESNDGEATNEEPCVKEKLFSSGRDARSPPN
jgi:hypothetical protein